MKAQPDKPEKNQVAAPKDQVELLKETTVKGVVNETWEAEKIGTGTVSIQSQDSVLCVQGTLLGRKNLTEFDGRFQNNQEFLLLIFKWVWVETSYE